MLKLYKKKLTLFTFTGFLPYITGTVFNHRMPAKPLWNPVFVMSVWKLHICTQTLLPMIFSSRNVSSALLCDAYGTKIFCILLSTTRFFLKLGKQYVNLRSYTISLFWTFTENLDVRIFRWRQLFLILNWRTL